MRKQARPRAQPPTATATAALVKTARWLLEIYDTGERVPPMAWEELRQRVGEVEAAGKAGKGDG
jgi:hypothetical protein